MDSLNMPHKRRHKIALKYRISTMYAEHELNLVQKYQLHESLKAR